MCRLFRLLVLGVVAAAMVTASVSALAQAATVHRYFGHHPAPPGQGGFCYLNGPHPHESVPHRSVAHLFRNQGGTYYFVGDPYDFGYAHPAFAYDGHHPIHFVFGGGWCYLDGPHYHFFHPHRDAIRHYTVFGGRYAYLGPVDAQYHQLRPALYREVPPYAKVKGYASVYASHLQYAVQYGRRASVVYVAARKLPKKVFVPGMYAGVYFGLPGIHASWAVSAPGIRAQVGVSFPSVGIGVQVGGPGVVLIPGAPPPPGWVRSRGVPPGWRRGKKKGWRKRKRRGW